MFSVKPDAQAAIASFFAENPDIEKILRVYVTPGSCNGPMLSIMSDQVDPTDVAEEIGGITFCMDKNLAGETGLVSVSLKDGELVVRPERAFIDPSAFSCSCGCSGDCSSGCASDCASDGCPSGCCQGGGNPQ